MKDLEMRKICAKIVPKMFTTGQKLRRKQCCIDWKALEERGAFLEGHHRHLWDMATITAELTLFKGLKEDDFQGCFNEWKQRWDKCTASQADKNDVPDNM
jgi:hypothetical protein